jgi:FxLD family lantipeptide
MDLELLETDYDLDIRLVEDGPAATGYATATDDGCGSGNTGSSACSGGRA